ncbi:MAG TPA: DUF305 domain-containing protein [Gemmatimonadaceae bacterium]|nr:DUF305 domain-containing protein [Gemmatimonadaceae bacterium]
MRFEPSQRIVSRSFLGALGAAVLFVAAHAALIRAGRDTSWGAALAVAGTNGVLWFVLAPLAMWLGRRMGGATRGLAWQAALGVVCVPLFGLVQGLVGIGAGLRAEVPPLALVFYSLDLNITVLALAAVVLDVYAGRVAMARHNRRHLALEARLLEVRHDLLTLQLQPHFLFNALNSAVELVREAPAEAARVLRNLRTLFLATTQRSSQAAVSLADELDVVDAFIGVARARHADTLTFTRDVDEAALPASVPPLSLQPLVENAVQFALQSRAGAQEVSLHARLDRGRLYVRITNSRSQRDRPTPGLGIGLRNTRERLAHLFGSDHALTLTMAADRAIAELDVPFVPLAAAPAPAEHRFSDEFAVAVDPVAVGSPLPWLRRWSDRVHPAAGIIGFWTVAWVFWVVQILGYRLARGGSMPRDIEWALPDLASAISWMAITPVALLLGRRFPVRAERRMPAIAIHILGALGATAVNIGTIAVVFGLSTVPMNNVLNQIVVNCAIYTLLIVWTHAEPIARWFDERQTATRRLEAELARARWEATEMRLSPELIAGDLDRLATLVEVDAAGAEDEVLDMADALRRRLKGSESAHAAWTGSRPVSALAALLAAGSLAVGGCARTPSPAPRAETAAAAGQAPASRPAPHAADVNFMNGMIGHHAQALVMAGWAPSHGASASIQILAARIINAQRDEIGLLQSWLRDRGLPVPEAKPGPMRMTMNGVEHDMMMPGMLTEAEMKQLDAARGPEFDRSFLRLMIQHHQGAVSMVKQLFDTPGAAQDQTVFKLASDVSADQGSEIVRMQKMLAALTLGGEAR